MRSGGEALLQRCGAVSLAHHISHSARRGCAGLRREVICGAGTPSCIVSQASLQHSFASHLKLYEFSTYQSPLWFDKWSVLAVHLVVEAAGVAEIVAVAVPPPERGGGRPAVDALPTLCNRAGIRAAVGKGQLYDSRI